MYPQTHYIYLFPYSLHVLICDIGDTVQQLSLNFKSPLSSSMEWPFAIFTDSVCVCVSACCISLYILCMVYYFVVYMLDHTRHVRCLYSYLLFLQKKDIHHSLFLLHPPLLIQLLDPPIPPNTDMIVKRTHLALLLEKDLTWYISPTECL